MKSVYELDVDEVMDALRKYIIEKTGKHTAPCRISMNVKTVPFFKATVKIEDIEDIEDY